MTNPSSKQNVTSKVTPTLVAMIASSVLFAAMFATAFARHMTQMSSRPSWQMTARNSAQGAIIEIYKSNSNQPTYSTVLSGQTIDTEVERVSRLELPASLGYTTNHDETLRPGHLTVVIDETEIDILERALVVDGVTEILPQD